MRRVERAVILAAGLGTRLKWLTRETPKALMPVAGAPAIVHVIRALVAQGVRDIAINVHHHADVLMQALGDGSRLGVRLYYSPERQLLDSGGGVRTALNRLPGEGLVAVHNADVLCHTDIHRLAALCPDHGCALALIPNPMHHPKGDFALHDGLVSLADDPRFTFSGVSVWDAQALNEHAAGEKFPLTEPIRRSIAQGLCAGMLERGAWFDVGRPVDLMRARRLWRP